MLRKIVLCGCCAGKLEQVTFLLYQDAVLAARIMKETRAENRLAFPSLTPLPCALISVVTLASLRTSLSMDPFQALASVWAFCPIFYSALSHLSQNQLQHLQQKHICWFPWSNTHYSWPYSINCPLKVVSGGWASGGHAKLLSAVPASHMGTEFKSRLLHFLSTSLIMAWEGSRVWFKSLSLCTTW